MFCLVPHFTLLGHILLSLEDPRIFFFIYLIVFWPILQKKSYYLRRVGHLYGNCKGSHRTFRILSKISSSVDTKELSPVFNWVITPLLKCRFSRFHEHVSYFSLLHYAIGILPSKLHLSFCSRLFFPTLFFSLNLPVLWRHLTFPALWCDWIQSNFATRLFFFPALFFPIWFCFFVWPVHGLSHNIIIVIFILGQNFLDCSSNMICIVKSDREEVFHCQKPSPLWFGGRVASFVIKKWSVLHPTEISTRVTLHNRFFGSWEKESYCWRILARQQPILSNSEKKPKFVGCKIGDMHSRLCFLCPGIRGDCECRWKYRSISSNSPAQPDI